MLDMLTADAAHKHGHEYSPPLASHTHHAGNGSFFTQMPLSILGSVLRKQTSSPVLAPSPAEAAQSATVAPITTESRKSPMIIDADPAAASPSLSRPVSSSSQASNEGKPRKRAPRPKTTFNLAQPPPIAGPRRKIALRPKVLLQLHQVIPSRRPKPVYEVIPFSLLAPRSTRRLARTFKSRDRLCPNDLLIVKAEQYGNQDDEEKSDDERWGTRDVVGIICPAKRSDKDPSDRTEILLDDGSSWEVTDLPNGGYEFNFTDDHGLSLKRRWVPKPAHARRVSAMSNASQPLGSPVLGPEDRKFNFSTISASSRRHPVIASMSKTSIDVLETYVMPSATSPPTPMMPLDLSTPLATPVSIPDAASFFEKNNERQAVSTDDALRRFIVMSGIWVAFSENWSPAYSWSRNGASPYPLSTSATSRPAPNRTVSMSFIDSPRSASPASTSDDNRRTFPKIFRTGTQKLHSSASFTNSLASPTSAQTSPSSSPMLKTRSRRSNSTGNAELRPKGSTRKRFGLALEDQGIAETEEERQSKRSIELLRIRELALTDSSADSPALTPAPIKIMDGSSDNRSLSPPSPNPRTRKTQSAYNPVTTTGLWDSGVAEGNGLKSRPTSLVVLNEKMEKAKKKQERSKSKEKDGRRRSERFKQRVIGMFRREKT